MSGGEQEIERILKNHKIEYIFNYRFNEDSVKNKPYDFYIPSMNLCIEYDGEQHYHMRFDRTLLDLTHQKYIDNIKTQYCIDNNIKLIRIPYWKFNEIEKIIIDELK